MANITCSSINVTGLSDGLKIYPVSCYSKESFPFAIVPTNICEIVWANVENSLSRQSVGLGAPMLDTMQQEQA